VSRLLEDLYLRVLKCEWMGAGMRYICTESVGSWDVNEEVGLLYPVRSSQLVDRNYGIVLVESIYLMTTSSLICL
jgi:hypothetical protein